MQNNTSYIKLSISALLVIAVGFGVMHAVINLLLIVARAQGL